TRKITTFTAAMNGQKEVESTEVELGDPQLNCLIGKDYHGQLMEDIELLDGASDEFDMDLVSQGKLSPAFFGSALTNFGVETFLEHFLNMTTSPLPRRTVDGVIDPFKEDFSAFVFKIQANMNKAHRDRIAFMRIVSGKFEAGMEVNHVQGGRKIRLNQPQQMMAQDRKIVDEAYAGDIIGVFDPGIFSIGDTICASNEKFEFEGIPTFAPEHFARVRQIDTMKRKQFIKGVSQIAQEGAIQIFQEFNTGMEEIIVGVVGVLQFEVLTYRLENEYNVEVKLEKLPYEYIRWVENKEEVDVAKIQGTSDMKRIKDLKDNPLLLFVNSWSVGMVEERNPGLKLSEFGRN
ncbi:MAG: peptide chain release factor 3, partial [Hungatella hathewayi]|nr:peptide chain release factor 3 [Hungatella hathewayi]